MRSNYVEMVERLNDDIHLVVNYVNRKDDLLTVDLVCGNIYKVAELDTYFIVDNGNLVEVRELPDELAWVNDINEYE